MNDYVSNPELKRIFAHQLLMTLIKRHTPLSVRIHGESKNTYLSLLMHADMENNIIKLDELSPKTGHLKIEKNIVLKIESSDHGIPIKFKTRVRRIEQEKGIYYYVADFPKEVDYQQRRQAVRLIVPKRVGASISLTINDIETPVELFDISLTGSKIVGFKGKEEDVPFRANLPMKLQLPDEPLIEGMVELRRVQYERMQEEYILGVQFLELNRDAQRAINRFVVQLQRGDNENVG